MGTVKIAKNLIVGLPSSKKSETYLLIKFVQVFNELTFQ